MVGDIASFLSLLLLVLREGKCKEAFVVHGFLSAPSHMYDHFLHESDGFTRGNAIVRRCRPSNPDMVERLSRRHASGSGVDPVAPRSLKLGPLNWQGCKKQSMRQGGRCKENGEGEGFDLTCLTWSWVGDVLTGASTTCPCCVPWLNRLGQRGERVEIVARMKTMRPGRPQLS